MGIDELAAKAVNQTIQSRYNQVFSKKARDQRLAQARKTVRNLEGKDHPVLGKHISSIPLNEYYFLKQKYGIAALSDPEFMDWMRRRVLKPEGLSKAS